MSAVAPGIATQLPPEGSQRSHWLDSVIGMVPPQRPAPAETANPTAGVPATAGATLGAGRRPMRRPIMLGPGIRSASTLPGIPGMYRWSLHCHTSQPWLPQLAAGTHGLVAVVQWATHSSADPESAVVSPSRVCQK